MNLDQALVASVLDGGKVAYRDVLERGITCDVLLDAEAKEAFDFIRDYYSKHGYIPDRELVQGKLGVDLPAVPPGSAPLFFADEVFNRNLALNLKDGIEEGIEHLDKNHPEAAYEAMQEMIFKIHKLHLGDSKITSMFSHGDEVLEYYNRMKSGERGIITPWAPVNDATLGFGPEELILCVARSGVGKCLEKSSTCTDPSTGVERTIEEIFNNPGLTHVNSWSKEQGIHSREITQKVDTGHKQCFKLTFASGRSITVTPEHPLLTVEGWKKAEEFKVGMTAALPARTPAHSQPVDMDSDTVFMLALLLAEGTYTGHHVGFSNADPAIIDRAGKAASVLGAAMHHVANYDYDFTCESDQNRNPIRELLCRHGLDNTKAISKSIPESVYRLPLIRLSEFLTTLWMCDGYVDGTGPGITLASEKMVRQIQSLLLRFGIQSSVDYKKAKCQTGEFDAWRLRVYAFSWETFAQHIKLWGHKLEAFAPLLGRERNTNIGYPRVSDAFVSKMKALVGPNLGRWGDGKLLEVAKLLGRDPSHEEGHGSYWGIRELFGKHNSLWLRPFKAFCEVYGVTEEYKWIWNSDIFWDVIESIEDVGVQKIYDLTVAPTSCFVANDIIVHNTWLSLMIAESAWAQNKKVLYVTTEMSKIRIYLRFLAYHLRLPYGKLRMGKLGENMFAGHEQKLKDGIEALKQKGNFEIVGGNFDFRIETLAAAIDEVKPDIVVIDGIYLIKVPGKDRIERAANTFDETKRLCTHKKIPIVVTSQFNREVKANQANTAKAESIALSDAAVWHSTYILGMVQTDDNKIEKRMQMKQLKVRDGSGEDFELNWDFDTMNFSAIEGSSASAPIGDAVDLGNTMGGVESGGDTPF